MGRWDQHPGHEGNSTPRWQELIIGEGIVPHDSDVYARVTLFTTTSGSTTRAAIQGQGHIQYNDNVVYNWARWIVGGSAGRTHYADLINNYFIAGRLIRLVYRRVHQDLTTPISSANLLDANRQRQARRPSRHASRF